MKSTYAIAEYDRFTRYILKTPQVISLACPDVCLQKWPLAKSLHYNQRVICMDKRDTCYQLSLRRESQIVQYATMKLLTKGKSYLCTCVVTRNTTNPLRCMCLYITCFKKSIKMQQCSKFSFMLEGFLWHYMGIRLNASFFAL